MRDGIKEDGDDREKKLRPERGEEGYMKRSKCKRRRKRRENMLGI